MVISILAAGILVFIFSLVFLAGSAHFLVRAVLNIAKAIRVPSFVIGITVVSIAAATPEFLSVLISGIRKVGDLGIGNIIGASIFDLCLTLGVVSLIAKPQKLSSVENNIFVFSLFTIGVFALLGFDGKLSRLDGLLMFLLFIFYQYIAYKKGIKFTHVRVPFKKLKWAYVMAPLAVFTLVISAYLLISSGTAVAQSLKLPMTIVGMLLMAFGTSAVEFAVDVNAAVKKGQGLAFGTSLGSVIMHIFFAGGLAAVINPVYFNFKAFILPLLMLFATVLIFTTYVNVRKQSDKVLGVILLSIFVLFLVLNLTGVMATELHIP